MQGWTVQARLFLLHPRHKGSTALRITPPVVRKSPTLPLVAVAVSGKFSRIGGDLGLQLGGDSQSGPLGVASEAVPGEDSHSIRRGLVSETRPTRPMTTASGVASEAVSARGVVLLGWGWFSAAVAHAACSSRSRLQPGENRRGTVEDVDIVDTAAVVFAWS